MTGTPSNLVDIADLRVQVSIADGPVQGDGESVDGYGEYHGIVDVENLSATVEVHSADRQGALDNFLRQVMTRIVIANDGAVLHAAAIEKDSRAYIFAGRSGAGKSTVCELSGDYQIMDDDLIAVRQKNRVFRAWGLPRSQGPGGRSQVSEFGDADGLPVAAVFCLVQAEKTRLVPIATAEAVARTLALPRCEVAPETMSGLLGLVAELADSVPCYELHFQKNSTFWGLIDDR